MTRQLWTPAEVALLRQHYATRLTADLAAELGRPINRVLAKANSMGLRKDPAVHAETARLRMANPNHPGRLTQFKPGQVPVNKGVKRPPGWAPGRMAEAQFKPGNQPHTTLPIGSYRIHEGYLERKVSNAEKYPAFPMQDPRAVGHAIDLAVALLRAEAARSKT